jgi:hypothetical protein
MITHEFSVIETVLATPALSAAGGYGMNQYVFPRPIISMLLSLTVLGS